MRIYEVIYQEKDFKGILKKYKGNKARNYVNEVKKML